MNRLKRNKPLRDDPVYRQTWRVVDGAVRDALHQHPEYITKAGKRALRQSINKRVTGAVLGYATEVAQGRSGDRPAAVKGGALATWHPFAWLYRKLAWLRRRVGIRPRPASSHKKEAT